MAHGAIAFILKGYPRLSETFIAQEIRALEARGLDIRIVSLRHPTDRDRHPVHAEIRAPVSYLPEYLYQEPIRLWRGWRAARRLPGYRRALATWLGDLLRDPTPNRVRRFGQALVLAHELWQEVSWLHAHFIHTPASVTRYTSLMTALPWSCSTHARDIWTSTEHEIRAKLAECRWAVTCTAHNRDYLSTLSPRPGHVELVYHGLDLKRLPAPPQRKHSRDGRAPDRPAIILSVGRAVEKKGYDDLLEALAALPASIYWRFVHIGGGPLLRKLTKRAEALGIAGRSTWLGAQSHHAVLSWYRRADLFALACRVADDGDRDGLPNVLAEAQSQGLPCVATRVSAIPELINDGENGLLAQQRDVAGLSRAMERLVREPALRRKLGEAGCRKVRTQFSFEAGIGRLAEKFGLVAESDANHAAQASMMNYGS